MTIFETIKQRRSIGKMTEQRPSHEQIERLLEAATHAPNHHGVEPWKFFVLAGKARNELGEILAATLAAQLEDTSSEKAQALLAKTRHKHLRAPVVIIVAAEAPRQKHIVEIENVMAAAAAVENMLLTAEELGLAGIWRTGEAIHDPQVKRWLGLTPEDQIVAFVHVGYPATTRTERHPQPVEAKTSWLGWNE